MQDRQQIDTLIKKELYKVTQEEFVSPVMSNPIIFGDLRKALLRTKEERSYEDLLDYQALHDILLSVSTESFILLLHVIVGGEAVKG